MRLEDRVAIVTGGGSGIGRATCELVGAQGARPVVVDIVRERAQETARGIIDGGGRALAIEADVSNKGQVDGMMTQALDAFGQVDILVNNAAISTGTHVLEVSEEIWDQDLRVVLKSAYLCCKAVLPTMIAQRRGVILNIASVNGLAAYGEVAYSAAKAAMINLTRNMAVNYGKHNVRVNAICPGTVRTPIWGPTLEVDPQIFEKLAKWYPLGRVGEPDDIAQAALFLVSDDAAWITGETLVVDGGLTAGNFRMLEEIESSWQ
jgi:NAD(P)-dependent dehydrogenase (short-subunit alcohol dehydrogenase family)